MRLISAEDLFRKLQVIRDQYQVSDDIIDQSIAVGLDRAITEVVLAPTEGRKTND